MRDPLQHHAGGTLVSAHSAMAIENEESPPGDAPFRMRAAPDEPIHGQPPNPSRKST